MKMYYIETASRLYVGSPEEIKAFQHEIRIGKHAGLWMKYPPRRRANICGLYVSATGATTPFDRTAVNRYMRGGQYDF